MTTKAWKEANADKVKAYNAAYNAANCEKEKARQVAYRIAHPDRVTASQAANPEKRKARKAAYREQGSQPRQSEGVRGQQQATDPGQGVFDAAEDAAWQAAIDPLPQHAFDGARPVPVTGSVGPVPRW